MTQQAGGVEAAIKNAYAEGRYDGQNEFHQRLETLEGHMVNLMADKMEMEDQLAQHHIVLQYLIDNKCSPFVQWPLDD
jgi:hypothetical protein